MEGGVEANQSGVGLPQFDLNSQKLEEGGVRGKREEREREGEKRKKKRERREEKSGKSGKREEKSSPVLPLRGSHSRFLVGAA